MGAVGNIMTGEKNEAPKKNGRKKMLPHKFAQNRPIFIQAKELMRIRLDKTLYWLSAEVNTGRITGRVKIQEQ